MAMFTEVFGLLDAGENRLEVSVEMLRILASNCLSYPTRIQSILDLFVEMNWLIIVKGLDSSGKPYSYYEARNYWKYHRKREEKGANASPTQDATLAPKGSQDGALLSEPIRIEPKERIYIGISSFQLSPEFKEKIRKEGLPSPEANLPRFKEFRVFRDGDKQHTQEEWEYMYTNQLRYLAKPGHEHLRANQPKTHNNATHCTFTPKTPEQLKDFGSQPCLEPICSGSQKYCQVHFDYYQHLIQHLTRNRNED